MRRLRPYAAPCRVPNGRPVLSLLTLPVVSKEKACGGWLQALDGSIFWILDLAVLPLASGDDGKDCETAQLKSQNGEEAGFGGRHLESVSSRGLADVTKSDGGQCVVCRQRRNAWDEILTKTVVPRVRRADCSGVGRNRKTAAASGSYLAVQIPEKRLRIQNLGAACDQDKWNIQGGA